MPMALLPPGLLASHSPSLPPPHSLSQLSSSNAVLYPINVIFRSLVHFYVTIFEEAKGTYCIYSHIF